MLSRALRGLRQQFGTQVLSVATVALALFCLAGALLVLENVGATARRWGAPVRVTVFLAESASAENVEALRSALGALPEVDEVRYVSPSEARAALGAGGDRAVTSAPVELFPATLELRLTPAAVSNDRVASVAERVRRLPMVADVETYRGFTERLRGLLIGGQTAAGVMALAVLLCVLAVVSNTVRMSLASRRQEIEVMRLVGASPSYVRAPFLLEGAMLGGLGAVLGVVVLGVAFLALRGQFEHTLGAMLGLRPVFLSGTLLMLVVGVGCALGTVGSAVALRRGLQE